MVYRLYTDATGKANRYAWGLVLKSDELTIESSGPGSRGVNQTELIAVLEGLRRLQDGSSVTVYTDSVYVLKSARGRRSGFHGHLRERLLVHLERLNIKWVKVGKGKGPCPDHRKAHHLAREALFEERKCA